MTFDHPAYLAAAAACALLLFGCGTVQRHRRRRWLEGFTAMHPVLADRVPPARTLLELCAPPLAASLVLVALAGPHWEGPRLPERGMDLLFVLDVSRSMTASSGGEGSRLDAARRGVARLLPRLVEDRVGLVTFAGGAILACPLTKDRQSFRRLLEGVEPWNVPGRGSAPGAGIRKALEVLRRDRPGPGVVVLLSDGEGMGEPPEAALAAARAAAREGFRVCTAVFGSPEGAALPLPGGGFLEDRRGRSVISRPDPGFMERIAEAGEGVFVSAGSIPDPLAFLDPASTVRRGRGERSALFLWIALLLLVSEAFLPRVRRRLRSAVSAAALLLAALLLSGAAPVGGDKETFREGVKRFRAGDFRSALERFEAARARSPGDPALAVNLGLCRLMLGRPEEAGPFFEQALEASDPGVRRAARFASGLAAYRQACRLEGRARKGGASERARFLGRALFLARSARAFFVACLKEGIYVEAGAVDLELANRLVERLEKEWAAGRRRITGRGAGDGAAGGEVSGKTDAPPGSGAGAVSARTGTGEGTVGGETGRREKDGVAAGSLPPRPEKERIFSLLDRLHRERERIRRAAAAAWLARPDVEDR